MRNPLLKTLPAIFALLVSFTASATHILGWDLSYQYLGNNQYKFTATLYRDCLVGDPQAAAQDVPLYCGIFSQQNGSYINYIFDSIAGPVTQILPVNTVSGCIQETGTNYCGNYIRFSKTYTLPPPYDYIFVNQRCCMTGSLLNIINPGSNGMTMITKVPAGYNNNSAVFNSLPPMRFCLNMPFEIDYSATDPDGDSLAYRLVPVLAGGSPNDAKPLPAPPPYDTMAYSPLFSPGTPLNSLFVLDEKTGMARGRCNIAGRYIIGVACDEYRNGVKINTVMRVFAPLFLNCTIEAKADAFNDSLLRQVTLNDSLVAVQCGGNKTVNFTNHSAGTINSYYWNFGDPNTLQDTSSLANPQYTYPDTGKYLVTLVARGSNCNDTMKGYAVISNDVVTVDFTASNGLCIYDTMQLQDNSVSNGSAITQYAWVGNGTVYHGSPVNFYFTQPGQQSLTHYVVTANGCVASAAKTFDVQQAAVSAGNDTTVVSGTQLQLQANGGVSYLWTALNANNPLSSTNIADPVVSCYTTGIYGFMVIGTDNAGCKGADTVTVTVTKAAYVYVPTGFTPNGDGRNDVLKVFTSGCTMLEFRVYDRYGKPVFSTTDHNVGWDGTHDGNTMPMDTYSWTVTAKNGRNGTAVYRGNVTLLR